MEINFGPLVAPWGAIHAALLSACHEGKVDLRFNERGPSGPEHIVNGVPLGVCLGQHGTLWARSNAPNPTDWRNLRRLELMAAFGLKSFAVGTNGPGCLRKQIPGICRSDVLIMAEDFTTFVREDPDDLVKLRAALRVLVAEWGQYAQPLTPEAMARRASFFGYFERAALLAAA